jgi:hypothetical protein
MRKRIAGVIASHVVGFKETIPNKTLNQRLEEEFEFICKFKKPSFFSGSKNRQEEGAAESPLLPHTNI